MSIFNVRAAFADAYYNGGFIPKADIAQENIQFNPPADRAWSAFHFKPAQPSLATLGEGGTDALTGFIQIDLNYPANAAPGAAYAKAEDIKNFFKAGSRLTYSGTEVKITSCGYMPAGLQSGYYRIILTIYFDTRIQR